MRKVGMGAEKEEMEVQTVPYEEHMSAVREIERLQGLSTGLNSENEALKAENEALKAENEALKAENKPEKDKK